MTVPFSSVKRKFPDNETEVYFMIYLGDTYLQAMVYKTHY